VPGCGALGADDLTQIAREGGDDPGFDDAVHPGQIQRDRDWRFVADVILEGEFAEDEEELITPVIEVTGVDVEDGGDVVPDVADGDSLGVKLKQGHDFMMKHGGTEIRWGAVVWCSGTTGWSPGR